METLGKATDNGICFMAKVYKIAATKYALIAPITKGLNNTEMLDERDGDWVTPSFKLNCPATTIAIAKARLA